MEEEWVEYDGGAVREWHRTARRIRAASGVTVIPDRAFRDCEDLTAVDLSNVTTIAARAFLNCSSLERVVRTTAPAVEIGTCAFAECRNLTGIDLSNVTKIGEDAFRECWALERVSIPSTVTAIEARTFEDCTNLTEVELGEGIQCIGKKAFENCSALGRINIPSSVTDIESGAFSCCNSLEEVKLNEGLQQIGAGAFDHCTSLQSINIPSSTVQIGKQAFYQDYMEEEGVDDFVVDDFDSDDESFFGRCNGLRNATLQEGLEMIDDGAFWGCSLERITIPSSVKSVGSDAFYGCHNLAEVTLREGVHCIEDRAFGSCTSLGHITIPPVAFVVDIAGSSCQLLGSTMPKTIRGKKLVVSKWLLYRSPEQLAHAEAKVNEILGRNDLTEEENIASIREWFAYLDRLDVTTLLELAVWGCNMDGNERDAAARQAIRGNCGSDLNVIIPGVLSFLEG